MKSDVLQQYETRYSTWQRRATACQRADRWLARARRVIAYPVIIYVIFDPTVAAVLGPLAVVILVLAVAQTRYVRQWRKASRAADFHSAGIRRLNDDWIGRGDPGWQYFRAAGSTKHLYADDLDIFGPGSLFQLLCTARTRLGSDSLASWLTRPSSVADVQSRQAAARELRDDLDLRETLAALEFDQRKIWPQAVERWPTYNALLPSLAWRVLGHLLAWLLGLAVLGVLLFGATSRDPWGFLAIAIVAEAVFFYSRRRVAREIAQQVGPAGLTLSSTARLSAPFVNRTFQSPRLAELQQALRQIPGLAHPRSLRCYGLLLQNPVVHLLAAQACPWLDTWRRSYAEQPTTPSQVVGELEAICALAAYAFEHPEDSIPELVEQGSCFHGIGLAHPLLPASNCVRNDVRLDAETRLLIVSGSNMSGKSTLLRAVGMNAVLAFVGAVVRATEFKVSPLTLGTAMRFRDSLQEGSSYFSTSIHRLKQVVDENSAERPLLFLFDEMLSGTNSTDRVAGAEAVLRKLLDGGAIGMMTTHDLALTELSKVLGPTVVNAHCEHQLVDGKMTFDYRLRPGVVRRSNAVALMRSLGLEV